MPVTQEVKLFDLNDIALAVGQSLKIRTTSPVVDLLDEECPEGETWIVRMQVRIEITES